MLDLLYIGLVVLPLTIAAVAMLLMAWRGVFGNRDKPEAVAPAPAPPAPVRDEPPEAPVGRPSLVDLSDMVQAKVHVPRAPVIPAAPASETKRCPDCAEEVLAAARVCKHCRYRFDEPDYRGVPEAATWRPEAGPQADSLSA